MAQALDELILSLGISAEMAVYVKLGLAGLGIILLSVLSFFILRYILLRNIARMISKSSSSRDDILIEQKVFARLSRLAPALVLYTLAPKIFADYEAWQSIVTTLCLIYLTLIITLLIDALINAGRALYRTYPISRRVPITSFVQIAKILLYFFCAIALLSLILGKSPITFLTGLGALTAVLMFVFKDPILGFVAGLQLSANKMVAVGDWVEIPKYNVDGDIMEIGLTTVKIRNFDKTITTIPTQALINDSFKNWRGMQEAGGRRIKRALYIDLNSIVFCDAAQLERFSKIQYISEYISRKNAEISEHNQALGIDVSDRINGRKLTNIGTFRAYVEAYLRAHPMIRDDFTFLVRQLKPTEHGVPIEIYVFTKTTLWAEYEAIQADIFDHLLAVVPEFDLRLFQTPTGMDFATLSCPAPTL
mgnify:CR=1 FL=1